MRVAGCGRVVSCRGVTLPSFYRQRGLDVVCSLPHGDGMSKCVDLVPFVVNGTRCNASPTTDVDVNSSTCVDWNRYYTSCRATDTNPFQNAVSFDDIGHAWIAIFQVPRPRPVIFITMVSPPMGRHDKPSMGHGARFVVG